MSSDERFAPGWPGIPARWTSSAKSAVGTSFTPASRVWFTMSHGIFNEIYFPRVDQACVRDLGLVVTGPRGYVSEEKRDAKSVLTWVKEGVPAFEVTNSCLKGRYRIRKTVLVDPQRDCLLQHTIFTRFTGELADYRVYALLAPHLGNQGAGNTAWIGDYKGVPMLFAERQGTALALACSVPWRDCSVGFAGKSDGWRDLKHGGRLVSFYTRAENGNVAMIAEIDLLHSAGEFLLALGFGRTPAEAGNRARASLQDGFELAATLYVNPWEQWQRTLLPLDAERGDAAKSLYRASTAVMRSHEALDFPGGIIASLSIPWGFSKGDNDLGGYHLAWPRDLVEAAGGLLAAGGHDVACRVLRYLQATQEADGHWAQNMWLDGTVYWSGIQMDETALPVLLVGLAQRENALEDEEVARFWPMVRRAAAYLVCNGPISPEDRWEEDPGYSLFTVSAEIAALLVAADLAEVYEPGTAGYLRETADVWYGSLDRWMYAVDTDWCRRYEVDGYYVRLEPVDVAEIADKKSAKQRVTVKNADPSHAENLAYHLVSPDALALVRFGLRDANDPRILNTVKVIDALLKVEAPQGPLWHRYNGDGYGEHKDGRPFDGIGVGRGWPLLTGERAHFELAAGRVDEAERLCRALEGFASAEGLIPEQIWDQPDVPGRELFFGHPTGSAMPLVWAHGEYLKLLRSLRDGRVFDMPAQTVARYLERQVESPRFVWRFNHRIRLFPAGKILRIETLAQARVRWSGDGWRSFQDAGTADTTLGIHAADLATAEFAAGAEVAFTFFWPEADRWEGENFCVCLSK